MNKSNKIVHTLWIGHKLSLMENLTIKLLQKHGHKVHLWCYNKIENIPKNTIIRDASEIMPKESIFRYTGKPHKKLPNNGIGSLAHWSDQFQLSLLYKYGGIYSQLDLAYLKPLNFKEKYFFIEDAIDSKKKALGAFLMKCPKGSLFTKNCLKELKSKINKSTINSISWEDSMELMYEVLEKHNLEKYCLPKKYHLAGQIFRINPPKNNIPIIHWSNATNYLLKNKPPLNTYYEFLLDDVGLIKINPNNLKRKINKFLNKNIIKKNKGRDGKIFYKIKKQQFKKLILNLPYKFSNKLRSILNQ